MNREVMFSASQRPAGFTLIEVMIVLVIIGILASIAYPSYQNYARETRRSEAKSTLADLANREEKIYFQCNTYVNNLGGSLTAACGAAGSGLGLSVDPPPVLTMKTANGYYNIAVTAANATGFSATATAIGSQTKDTDCTTLTLNSTGAKTATGAKPSVCWTR
jgi:type IV pilus assembly protein PilE